MSGRAFDNNCNCFELNNNGNNDCNGKDDGDDGDGDRENQVKEQQNNECK